MADDPDNEEQNVYRSGSREQLVEDDEITPEEEGFMAGYDEAEDYDSEEKKEEE
ncbi:hypothetical protein J4460_03370 [Candidatus Woesearchaeota archaeon]|nr:MAG: hypothetical protein QS99_C0008G0044 [archaeon GW2011_AR4]MBS3129688.1 hypothetical protein [Candidatus Woesearchaeota archaeon]HIH38792.1 hypothetical protein [Candidatus Woesearchaeota archaeon]HIH49207.1 hypothetical protein [Candidatus Woesearchaeota archaeon]HIJ03350.1 hypothetical protein [Candidatus Woesearchaeota archaeon]